MILQVLHVHQLAWTFILDLGSGKEADLNEEFVKPDFQQFKIASHITRQFLTQSCHPPWRMNIL